MTRLEVKKKMSYELKQSEYISADEIVGTGFSIKVLEKITDKRTDWGMKPSGKTELIKDGKAIKTGIMNYNQPMINGLILKAGKPADLTGKYDSADWVGLEIPVEAKQIKGNLAIVPKRT